MRLTRRHFVAALARVLGGPGVASAQTAAPVKVKFALDWQIQGPQAPILTAKGGGGFAAQGLDVTIDRGSGSQKTIELVATSTYAWATATSTR
jgi:NitT/TauT family transport system substrate-binding protein